MINKEHLLRGIEKLARWNEELLPLLERHVASSVLFSGLPNDRQKALLLRLKDLAAQTRKHQEAIREVRDRIQKESADVF